MLRIHETFIAIQGEGTLIGTPSLFIRMHGCNLVCSWCDTPLASVQAGSFTPTKIDSDALFERLMGNEGPRSVRHVVLTGGEPTLQAFELDKLARRFKVAGYHVTLETNGQFKSKVVDGRILYREVDLLSMSPKLYHSDWLTTVELLRKYNQFVDVRNAQVKIVVGDTDEIVLAYKKFRYLRREGCVFTPILQPESNRGITWAKTVAIEATKVAGDPAIRVIPQVHRLIGVQ